MGTSLHIAYCHDLPTTRRALSAPRSTSAALETELAQLKQVLSNLLQNALDYAAIAMMPFDVNAAQAHGQLRKAYPRLGTMDLKIAAIAIAQQATLLTRNTSDFAQIADLLVEDWST